MKYYFAIALAIIASLFTACTQATSPESNIYEGMMTCEEAQAYYTNRLQLVNNFDAEGRDADAYTSGYYRTLLAEAKAAVEANCN